jgi:hypothetical protein
MIVMESYFDDSADPRRERYYACGGLFGRRNAIDFVDASWSYETKREGLTKPVRCTELECGYGQFNDPAWPKSRRDNLMKRLVGVLRQYRVWGYASIVPADAYKRAFPRSTEHDPFLLAVTQTIHNMIHLAELAKAEVSMWFEDSKTYPSVARIYQDIKTSGLPAAFRMRGIAAASKKLRPLQAADLVAREAFKYRDNLGVRPTRKPVTELSEQLYFTCWTEEALHYLAQHGGRENLELLLEWDQRPDAPRLEMFIKRNF